MQSIISQTCQDSPFYLLSLSTRNLCNVKHMKTLADTLPSTPGLLPRFLSALHKLPFRNAPELARAQKWQCWDVRLERPPPCAASAGGALFSWLSSITVQPFPPILPPAGSLGSSMEKSVHILHGNLDALAWPSLSSWWVSMISKYPHWSVMSPWLNPS